MDKGEIHIKDLESSCPNVNRRTLQRDLRKLEELGLIQRKGGGPTIVLYTGRESLVKNRDRK